MSRAPSPKSAARTKGTVHLGKSLLDFHLTLSSFALCKPPCKTCRFPRKNTKQSEEQIGGGGLSVFQLQTPHPKGEEFGKLLASSWVTAGL